MLKNAVAEQGFCATTLPIFSGLCGTNSRAETIENTLHCALSISLGVQEAQEVDAWGGKRQKEGDKRIRK